MHSWVNRDLPRALAVAIAFLAGSTLLSGCGDGAGTSGDQIAPEDPAEIEARNTSMEDYMKSAEGKKATRGPR